jgi:hypothetical protein
MATGKWRRLVNKSSGLNRWMIGNRSVFLRFAWIKTSDRASHGNT